jgi:hypothetical protein
VAFLRNKQSSTGAVSIPDDLSSPDSDDRKGRPTPKRKESEAANKRPLVASDRKAASRDSRSSTKSAQRAERAKQYQGMKAGDERFLPAKDKGPERRFVRDWVDSRWNIAEFFLPMAVIFLIAMILTASSGGLASFVIVVALYALVIVAVIDGFVMWRQLRKRLIQKFGTVTKGTTMYALMRAFQIRRVRLPKPRSPKHGARPE